MTQEQRGEPHLLVIPIRCIPTILELADEEAASLMVAVREAAKMIDSVYKKPGIVVWQNNGISVGQAVSHLHFHVAGTLPTGGTEFGKVERTSMEETDKIAKKLLSGE